MIRIHKTIYKLLFASRDWCPEQAFFHPMAEKSKKSAGSTQKLLFWWKDNSYNFQKLIHTLSKVDFEILDVFSGQICLISN